MGVVVGSGQHRVHLNSLLIYRIGTELHHLSSGEPFPGWLRNGVLAVGSFDGFHRGHAAVIARARAIAGLEGRPLIAATFSPSPTRFFRPDAPPGDLATMSQLERLLASFGVDVALVVNYHEHTGRFSADDMVGVWLRQEVGASTIVTGEHFNFGQAREGDATTLTLLSAAAGMRHEIVPAERDRSGTVISSERIRDALRRGDCRMATQLLARPFSVEGKVRHGNKLARTIGFPTANMLMGDYARPCYGVYAVRGRLPFGRILDGVANVGIRPMMDVSEEWLETHFFDYSGDLYGQNIEIDFVEYLRGEEKLSDFEELKRWITRDAKEARAYLAETPRYN